MAEAPPKIWAWEYPAGTWHTQMEPEPHFTVPAELPEAYYVRADWLPIETAPQDGSRILGCRQGSKWHQVLYFQDGDEWGWYGMDGRAYYPTHWQPLMEQPA